MSMLIGLLIETKTIYRCLINCYDNKIMPYKYMYYHAAITYVVYHREYILRLLTGVALSQRSYFNLFLTASQWQRDTFISAWLPLRTHQRRSNYPLFWSKSKRWRSINHVVLCLERIFTFCTEPGFWICMSNVSGKVQENHKTAGVDDRTNSAA